MLGAARKVGASVDPDAMKKRTMAFALRVIRLVRGLPRTVDGRAVAAQLVRCGTAVGANYRAACKARSRAEFIAKIGVVEEEADESCFWLELIIASELLKASLVQPLYTEAAELAAIFAQSRITAAQRRAAQA